MVSGFTVLLSIAHDKGIHEFLLPCEKHLKKEGLFANLLLGMSVEANLSVQRFVYFNLRKKSVFLHIIVDRKIN